MTTNIREHAGLTQWEERTILPIPALLHDNSAQLQYKWRDERSNIQAASENTSHMHYNIRTYNRCE